MEHDPTNEFPAGSSHDADETAELLDTAPHAATVPVPPPVPSAVAAPLVPPASSGSPLSSNAQSVPPPPPPASYMARQYDYSSPSNPPAPPVRPPTQRFVSPPISSSPPRPGTEFGPEPGLYGFGASATPVAVVAAPRRWPWAVGGFLAATLLALSGFAAGLALQDDSPSIASSAAAGQVVPAAQSTAGGESVIEDVPGPLTGDESVEPVAAVANALSPSVVTITNDIGQGSGIVWDSSNGYILTNDHVVGDSTNVTVIFPDGNSVPGEVIGTDSARDIAVIQVDSTTTELVDAVFAPTSSVSVGQLAVAIGSPFSLDQTVTSGIVSAVNRVNPDGGSDPLNGVPVAMIQTDAPINPGNSGGALADRQGRVIGMNTSIRTDGVSTGNVGVGFAVPSDTVILIAERIVNNESLDTAFLGVLGRELADGSEGSIINEITAGSAADAAGLLPGDRIIGLDGERVSTMAQLGAAITLYRPGETAVIEFERNGSINQVEVELGQR